MNIKKYEHFGVEDFTEDEYFCRWALQKEEQLDLFWKRFIQQYPHKQEKIIQAEELVQSFYGYFKTKVETVSQQKAKDSFQKIARKIEENGQIVTFRQKLFRWSAAASVLLILSVAAYYFLMPTPNLLTYSTGNGQRMNILLPDSSQIQLNANSVLSYDPENWTEKGLREVALKGEAFFKVTKKKVGTKFIVHSGPMNVSVLGTAFNVRSRGEASEVVLAEGKIELSIADQKIAMQPGDFISYSETQQKIESKKVKTADYTAWKDGIIVFNKNLSEVVKDLEILYGISFKIEKENLNSRLIQLSAPADSLEQVLEILEIMYSEDINIELEEGQIRIY